MEDEKGKAVSKGVSASPTWWETLEEQAEEMGLNRSSLIRLAVNDYLKDGGKRREPETAAA